MPEKVFINSDLKIIEIDSYGIVSKEEMENSMALVEQFIENTGTRKVLIDASSQTNAPSFKALSEFGEKLSDKLIDVQFSVFTSENVIQEMQFLSLVGFNSGTQIKIFPSRQGAVDWLLNS